MLAVSKKRMFAVVGGVRERKVAPGTKDVYYLLSVSRKGNEVKQTCNFLRDHLISFYLDLVVCQEMDGRYIYRCIAESQRIDSVVYFTDCTCHTAMHTMKLMYRYISYGLCIF